MNPINALWYNNMQPSIYAWWDSKSKEQQYQLELITAIIAPGLGSMLGMFIVFLF